MNTYAYANGSPTGIVDPKSIKGVAGTLCMAGLLADEVTSMPDEPVVSDFVKEQPAFVDEQLSNARPEVAAKLLMHRRDLEQTINDAARDFGRANSGATTDGLKTEIWCAACAVLYVIAP